MNKNDMDQEGVVAEAPPTDTEELSVPEVISDPVESVTVGNGLEA